MDSVTCPITQCQAEALEGSLSFDGRGFFCRAAGGKYRISNSLLSVFSKNPLKKNTVRKLCRFIYERQDRETPILITCRVVSQVESFPPLRPIAKAEKLLRYLDAKSNQLGFAGLVWGQNTKEDGRWEASAASELEISELNEVLDYLVRKGFCSTKIDDAKGEGLVWLTLEGADHIAIVDQKNSDANRAFVAMWFSNAMMRVYDNAIVPAIVSTGYEPVRIDRKEHNNKIDDEIIVEIRNARFLIADFTCELFEDNSQTIALARGGVYFEAGFAMGLGIPVIWTVREDLIDHVHFDTRQYNHIVWSDEGDLKAKLEKRIGATIGRFVEGQGS